MMRAPLRRVIFAPGQRFTAAAKVARARSRSLAPLAASLLSTRPGFHFTARSRQHAHGSLRRSDNRGAHAAFAASYARWRAAWALTAIGQDQGQRRQRGRSHLNTFTTPSSKAAAASCCATIGPGLPPVRQRQRASPRRLTDGRHSFQSSQTYSPPRIIRCAR
jgi:hypothetical protein